MPRYICVLNVYICTVDQVCVQDGSILAIILCFYDKKQTNKHKMQKSMRPIFSLIFVCSTFFPGSWDNFTAKEGTENCFAKQFSLTWFMAE